MVAAKRYSDAPFVKLEQYLPASQFRTVMPAMFRHRGGRQEIKVDMDLGAEFIRSLDNDPTFDGITVYGFVWENPMLIKAFGEDLEQDRWHCLVSLVDWGDRFLMICTGLYEHEYAVFVTPNEVRYLLTHCRRARVNRKKMND